MTFLGYLPLQFRFLFSTAASITSASMQALPCWLPIMSASDIMVSITRGLPWAWPATALSAASSMTAFEDPALHSL